MSAKALPALWFLTLWFLTGLTFLNGAAMVAAPGTWYATTPGVSHTGPYNPHFIRDIGFTYLAMATAYFYAIRDPAARAGVLLIAATWMGLHGLLHVIECFTHPWETGPRLLEIAFVIIPGVVTALLAVRTPATKGA